MAMMLSKWLRKIAEGLESKNLPFEAGDTWSLSEDFDKLVENGGDAEAFAMLWQDMEQWGQMTIVSGGREKELCEVPHLPRILEE